MQWMGRIALLVVLGWAGTRIAGAGDEPRVLAITHVSVIDPGTGVTRTDQTVVIAAGRIQRIVPSVDYEPEAGARLIVASGKYLIPGLWDMHVHIA